MKLHEIVLNQTLRLIPSSIDLDTMSFGWISKFRDARRISLERFPIMLDHIRMS